MKVKKDSNLVESKLAMSLTESDEKSILSNFGDKPKLVVV